MEGLGSVVVVSHMDQSGKENIQVVESEGLFLCPVITLPLRGRAVEIVAKKYLTSDDVGALMPLMTSPENCRRYGLQAPFDSNDVNRMVQEGCMRAFQEGNPWTSYRFSRNTGETLGIVTIEEGFSSAQNMRNPGVHRGLYQAVLPGKVEVQLREFFVAPTEEREGLYRQLMITMLAAAMNFVGMGEKIHGKPVERVIVTLPYPSKDYQIDPEFREELEMKKRVLDTLFGQAMGILLPKRQDPRNDCELVRAVYGYDMSRLHAIARSFEEVDVDD